VYPLTHSLDTITLLKRPKNNLSKKESRKWRNGGVPMAWILRVSLENTSLICRDYVEKRV